MWNHPITNEFKMHYGADYKASVGQSVHAAASGTVLDSHYMNGYGNTVVL
jgi:murein DD-endopeptidase MepM/ murein hydrolase activator NlpD